ncbi:MAG: hypothetical protein KIT73_02270 [Burkholderiales bacterium]|nr:hypothetical protein [Burkholderiales bacterium]
MIRFEFAALAAAFCIALIPDTAHAGMSQSAYKAALDEIAAQHASDQAGCRADVDQAYADCMAEAKARAALSKAEVTAVYNPSARNQYDLALAKAESVYATALTACSSRAGNAKSKCRQDASDLRTRARTEAQSPSRSIDAKAPAAAAR